MTKKWKFAFVMVETVLKGCSVSLAVHGDVGVGLAAYIASTAVFDLRWYLEETADEDEEDEP